MPLDTLRKRMYLYTRQKNFRKEPVRLKNLLSVAMRNGFTAQEGGEAIQQLKKKRALYYSPKNKQWFVR